MTPPANVTEPPGLDPEGRYRQRGRISYAVVGTYLFLLLLVLFVLLPRVDPSYLWVPYFLVGVLLLFLVRYLSTTYTIDDTFLRASRLLGGRKIHLEEVRRIEYATLRDLAPVGSGLGLGSWGWRGRMYSPSVGDFDSIYTDPARGVLVTAGAHPLYVSPQDTEGFARELSRRVRSYTGPLLKDVGNPYQGPDDQ